MLLVGLVSDEALRESIRAGGSGAVRFAGDPAGLVLRSSQVVVGAVG